jgi:hypothetical protein
MMPAVLQILEVLFATRFLVCPISLSWRFHLFGSGSLVCSGGWSDVCCHLGVASLLVPHAFFVNMVACLC